MSEISEKNQAPDWLAKLEEQREKRLKAKLGHEAGAGAPCQVCLDKCPGLDLHFWRKICKICKCGKENHDVNDDDIYGFVQFQLLGSKPTKAKSIFLDGKENAITLDWTPKGSNNDVQKYLEKLPEELLPVKGSEAAKLRKQRLQKQLPAHDIDASLCHALTPEEIQQLEEYVAHIRNHSVGQGKIIQIPILHGDIHKMGHQNPQFLNQQLKGNVSASQLVNLQKSNLSQNLQNLSLKNRSAFLNSQISDSENPDTQNRVPVPKVDPESRVTVPKVAEHLVSDKIIVQNPISDENAHLQNPEFAKLVKTSSLPKNRPYDEKIQKIASNQSIAQGYPTYTNLSPQKSKLIDNASVQPGYDKILSPNQNTVQSVPSLPINPTYLTFGTQTDPRKPNFGTQSQDIGMQNPNFAKTPNLGQQNPNFGSHDSNSGLQDPNFSRQNEIPPNFERVPYLEENIALSENYGPKNPNMSSKLSQKGQNQFDPKTGHFNSEANYNQQKVGYPKGQFTQGYGDQFLGQGDPNLVKNDPNMIHDPNLAQKNHFNQGTGRGHRDPYIQGYGDQFLDQGDPNLVQNDPNSVNNPNLAQNRSTMGTTTPYGNFGIKNKIMSQGDPNDPNMVQDPNLGQNRSNIGANTPYSNFNNKNQFVGQRDPNLLQNHPNMTLDDPNMTRNDPNMALNDPNLARNNQNLAQNDPNLYENVQLPLTMSNVEKHQEQFNNDFNKLKNKNLQPKIPTFTAQNQLNPYEMEQNMSSIGYIRDIEYHMSKMAGDEDIINSNLTVTCHKCKNLFTNGDFAVSVDRTESLWHSDCFNCHTCAQPLADLLYFYHKDTDNIYCGRDYAILKGIPRCSACDELIFVREYCLAEDRTFHVKHFCCFECDEPLAGKQYVMENDQPNCVDCYEKLKAEKCNDCGFVIGPDEQGVNLKDLHWHATEKCFACKHCRKGLLGGKMLLRNQNLFCSDVCFKTYYA